jgi:ankyrin repeat protein
MYAAEFGHLAVAKILVEAGADLNVRDGDRETALGIARRRGHLDIVRLLTDQRAWE